MSNAQEKDKLQHKWVMLKYSWLQKTSNQTVPQKDHKGKISDRMISNLCNKGRNSSTSQVFCLNESTKQDIYLTLYSCDFMELYNPEYAEYKPMYHACITYMFTHKLYSNVQTSTIKVESHIFNFFVPRIHFKHPLQIYISFLKKVK